MRPENSNNFVHNPDLAVDSLINTTSRTWNSQVIRDLVDLQDPKIIESIPLSMTHMVDKDG